MSAAKPVIVLVRPQLGQNIGKAARAMLNFGLTEMRLVAPRDGWPNPDAGPAASGADIVLEQAQVFDTVAGGDRRLLDRSSPRPSAAATSSCRSSARRRWRDEIARLAGRSAILFGPERSGLETEDVALANAIVTVPINPEFGSLNLAQAVILLAYEWSQRQRACPAAGQGAGAARAARRARRADRPARRGARGQGLFPPAVAHRRRRKNTIRTIFTKTGWSSREVKAVRGIIRALVAEPRSSTGLSRRAAIRRRSHAHARLIRSERA